MTWGHLSFGCDLWQETDLLCEHTHVAPDVALTCCMAVIHVCDKGYMYVAAGCWKRQSRAPVELNNIFMSCFVQSPVVHTSSCQQDCCTCSILHQLETCQVTLMPHFAAFVGPALPLVTAWPRRRVPAIPRPCSKPLNHTSSPLCHIPRAQTDQQGQLWNHHL